ncbi:hypothetical protein L4C36_07540 [Photobacterium japonica]|uniref:hypothetical protein n=1 Tax=Photobacterium japonica TaxID=2910235 RepID=UPI003D144896
MKNVLIALLALCALSSISGCAEKMYVAKGAEALVYPETHTYQFTVNNSQSQNGAVAINTQLTKIVAQAQQRDHQFRVTYLYSSTQGKRIAQQQIAQLHRQGVSASQYNAHYAAQPKTDLTVELRYFRVLTETCQPEVMGQPIQRRDCFVDTMRMKQVANPQRLIEK